MIVGSLEENDSAPVDIVSGRAFHLALLAAGTLFFLITAFHGNVWFDESYSVGIAGHSFADIWEIGASDVHPVLFYWCLHALSLVLGQSILAYRVFALLGAVALAALGYTHVRRYFGWKAGLLFSFLAFFTPYMAIMAVEIRMYTWAVFAVTLCAICAWRVCGCVRGVSKDAAIDSSSRLVIVEEASGLSTWAGVPRRWWASFFLSSLACAYLHYFGALSAFAINVLTLAFLLSRGRKGTKALLVFLLGAVLQLLCYAPWLVALASQLSVVGNTYWANFVFPTTLIELWTYPIVTSFVSFGVRGSYGAGAQIILQALLVAFAILAVALVVAAFARGARALMRSQDRLVSLRRWACGDCVLAALGCLVVYAAVWAMADVASDVMDSFLLYYRYLLVAMGPLLLAASIALSRSEPRRLVRGVCAIVFAVSIVNQALAASDFYSEENEVPLDAVEEAYAWACEDGLNEDPLVLSSDIGVQGVAAICLPDISETYMDWQPGNWGKAYEAYAPTLRSVKTWEDALDPYEGRFVVIGQSSDGSLPRDVSDVAAKPGVMLVESETYYRPYERTYFTVATMVKS